MSPSQWPRCLRLRPAAPRLLRLWLRIPRGAWMFVCCDWCVLSGRGLCDELITHPEESYRMSCVVVYDLEISWIRRLWLTGGCRAKKKQTKHFGLIIPNSQVNKKPSSVYFYSRFSLSYFRPVTWFQTTSFSRLSSHYYFQEQRQQYIYYGHYCLSVLINP